jgi:hypothetical protein
MAGRDQANRIAAGVALLVFVVVLVFVDREGDFDQPRTVTMEISTVQPAPPSQKVTTSVTRAGGRRAGSTRTTEAEQPSATPATRRTTTTEIEPRSFLERVLGDKVIEFLIALLAAFLAGAIVQRVLLGRYGGSRAAGLGAAEIADAAADAQKKLPAEIAAAITDATAKLQRESRAASKEMKLELARLYAMIVELEYAQRRSSGIEDLGEVSEAQQHVERLAREAFALDRSSQSEAEIADELQTEKRLRKALASPTRTLEQLSGR